MMYRVSFLTPDKAISLSIAMNDYEREQLERAFGAATQTGNIKEWTIEKQAPMGYHELRDFMDREGFFNLKDGESGAPSWPYDWDPPVR